MLMRDVGIRPSFPTGLTVSHCHLPVRAETPPPPLRLSGKFQEPRSNLTSSGVPPERDDLNAILLTFADRELAVGYH